MIETDQPVHPPRRSLLGREPGAALAGLALIAAGVLLALDRADVVDAVALLTAWWPAAVVIAGVWWVAGGERIGGAIAMVVGVALLLTTTGAIEADLGHYVFPLLLVAVGVMFVVAGSRMRAAGARTQRAVLASRKASELLADGAATGAVAVFGDTRLSLTDGGRDVRAASVNATALFGTVELVVPSGWRVRDRALAVLGSVEVPGRLPDYPEAPVLDVHGLALFGSIEVSVDEQD